MKRFNAFRFICFFYNHCIKSYAFSILIIGFAAIYWAIDLQFRHWIVKDITDKFLVVDQKHALHAMLPLLYVYFSVMILRLIVFNFSHYLRIYYMPLMKTNLVRFLLKEILLKSNVLIKKNVDLLSNQIQEILKNFEHIINTFFVNIFAHLTLLITSCLIFSANHMFLFYSISVLYAIFFIVALIGYTYGVKLNRDILSFDMVLFSRLNDVFSNLFNIKLMNTYEYEDGKMQPFLDQYQKISVAKDFWNFTINACLSIVFVFYHLFCMTFIIYQYQIGQSSISDFPYIFAVNREITEALWCIVDDFNNLAEYVGKAQDALEKIFSDTLLLESKLDKIDISSFDINYGNVSFAYHGSDELLFENLSLSIKQGDKVGIVGYSGSGKSSLTSLLLNLCPLKGGLITIGGHDIRMFSYNQLNSLITFMNQDLALFNRSIRENIMYGNLHATEEDMIDAAKMANIHEFIESRENGYDTVLEYQGKELSYGQKQRLLIARAFLRNTPILILDEVTSSLDAKSEAMVMDSLVKLMKNKTVFVIAHKIKTLFGMDYIIGMNKGKIVEIGTHEELLEKKAMYYELLKH